MPQQIITVSTERSPEEVFAYLADFRSAAEWDPGVASVDLASGTAGEGATPVPSPGSGSRMVSTSSGGSAGLRTAASIRCPDVRSDCRGGRRGAETWRRRPDLPRSRELLPNPPVHAIRSKT